MTEIFYVLAGVDLLLQSLVLAVAALKILGVHRLPHGESLPDEGEKAWNDGFRSLLAYDIEKAKGSVRDDG